MRTIDQMIDQEILMCVSELVYNLTQQGNPEHHTDEDFDLWSPVIGDDAYEECAQDAGWDGPHKDAYGATYFEDTNDGMTWCAKDWEELCNSIENLYPEEYAGEVFEHWAVTGWFADKLEEAGERVVRDWHGLTIWARTTTGQNISADHVIQKIYEEAHK